MPLPRPRFRLRSLLIVTALIAVILAFQVQRIQRKREALGQVMKLGAVVKYDYEKATKDRSNVFDSKALPIGPRWLRDAVGTELFEDVVMIDLSGKPITDNDLKELWKLPKVENLNLSNTRVTGAGMVHLASLKSLKCLTLWNTQVDDDGLRHLAGLTKLQLLILDGTRVTDAGLKHLEGLTDLNEWLGLTSTEVTDAGMIHLKGLTKLRQVNVRLTKVTADGAKALQKDLPKTEISYR